MTIVQINIERKIDMKKRLCIKSAAVISTLLAVTGVFTACGKADRKDIERDLSENVTSDAATKSDAEQVIDKDIPDKLTYTINGAQGTIKVNADVYADGYGNVPVYNIKNVKKMMHGLMDMQRNFLMTGNIKTSSRIGFAAWMN